MKKIIIIFATLLITLAASAQLRYYDFPNDTVFGNENVYFTAPAKSLTGYDYLVGFSFKPTQIAGAIDAVYLQGSVDGTNWITIDYVTTPTTATTYFIYDYISNTSTLTTTTITNAYTSAIASSIDTCGGVADTATFTAADTATSTTTSTFSNVFKQPICTYMRYRLWCDGGSGDTVIVDPTWIVKKRED